MARDDRREGGLHLAQRQGEGGEGEGGRQVQRQQPVAGRATEQATRHAEQPDGLAGERRRGREGGMALGQRPGVVGQPIEQRREFEQQASLICGGGGVGWLGEAPGHGVILAMGGARRIGRGGDAGIRWG